MYINRLFKDVIYLFCCQDYLKIFLENYRFIKNLGMMHIVGGGGGFMLFTSKIPNKKTKFMFTNTGRLFFSEVWFQKLQFHSRRLKK